jgi:hypothetical protein
VVFIDRGEQSGVAPGQRYNIIYQEITKPDPNSSERVALLPVILGEVIVLRAEPTTATVVLTNSKKDVYPGAQIRSPMM